MRLEDGVAAVLLFLRTSSDGGVVRKPRSPLGVLQSGNLYFFFPLSCAFFLLPPFLTSLTSTVFLQNGKTSEVGVAKCVLFALRKTAPCFAKSFADNMHHHAAFYELGICLFHEIIM